MVEKKSRKKRGENYLTNKDFYPVLLRAKKLNRITPELGKMFIILVNRYAEHPWWCNYSEGWKTEMKQDALLALCKGALKFDETYAISNGKTPNPFSYCTTIVYRAFKASRDKDKRQTDLEDIVPPGLF